MADSTRPLAPALRALLASARQDADADLLDRFVSARDEPAFVELMRRHGPMVLGVSRRVTRDAHAAEDVFQATFLLLARKAESIRRAEVLGAWLHRTAFRLALRSRKLGRAVESTRPRPSAEPSPLDALTARELLGILDEELARLPDEHRAAIVLCGLEGLSLDEAAQRLGWTRGAVKGRLERGRARLRQRVEERGLTLSGAMAAPLLDGGSCAGLMQATRAAVFEGQARGSVLALIEGGVSATSLAKVSLVSVMLLSCALLALGATIRVDLPPDKPATPPALNLDPLPEGARLRLGAMDRRAIDVRLAVTPDGDAILGARQAGRWVQEWDFRTGKARGRRVIPSNPAKGTPLWELSPDGRWLATLEEGATKEDRRVVLWDVRSAKPVRKLPAEGIEMVSAAAFSRDGGRLAVVSRPDWKDPRRFRVWDTRTGAGLLDVPVEGTPQLSAEVTFSPDGKLVLVVRCGEGITCWDVAAKKQLWTTKGTVPWHVVVTPKGTAISSEHVRKLVERDLLTGRATATLELPPIEYSHGMAVTPAGDRLLKTEASELGVWDLASGKRLWALPGAWADFVVAAAGQSVVTNDGVLQRWDLRTGKSLYPDESSNGHRDEVVAVRFTGDGTRLVSAGQDGAIAVWDATAGTLVRRWRAHFPRRAQTRGGGIDAFDLSSDGRTAASVGHDDRVRVWDVTLGKETHAFARPEPVGRAPREIIHQVRVADDGRTVVGVLTPDYREPREGPPARLVRWDLATGKMAVGASVDDTFRGMSALDPSGHRLAAADRLYDAATGKEIGRLTNAERPAWPDVTFSPDGGLIVGDETWRTEYSIPPYAYEHGRSGLRVWEAVTGKLLARLPSLPRQGEKAVHPSGRYVACNDLDGVRLWDLRSEKEIKHWQMPAATAVRGWHRRDVVAILTDVYRVSSLAFSPDGKTLATGHPDGTILLWDVNLPAEKPNPPRPGELESLWKQLGDDDVRKAYRAAWRLAELPGEAVPFLRDRLRPVRPAPAEVTRAAIDALDDDAQAKRDEATKRLRDLGHRAEPALRAALKAPASAEQKRRLEQLLAPLEKLGAISGEQVRDLRAVQVLGWIGTPEAKAVLRALAEGVPSDVLTRQAAASLARRF